MAPSNRHAVLAIEWVWLLIGTGVVLAHLVEAWAAPYLPLIWMTTGLLLFLLYRFGAAIRHIYFPQPEPEEEPPSALRARVYEDDAPSTAEVVLPHMRGRRRRQDTQERDAPKSDADLPDTDELAVAEPPERLAVPSADGAFYDDDLATVLADIDDSDDPEATLLVDKSDLRKETEADVTTSAITIPTFAESSLSPRERDKVMDSIRGRERRERPSRNQPSVPDDEESA